MKVLYLYSYYKPEKTSGAHLAEDERRGLADAGHTMFVYTPTPTRGVDKATRKAYKKRKREVELDGAITVRRFALFGEGKNTLMRAFRYFLLECRLFWFGLTRKKKDLLVLGSTPPINGLMGTMLKKLRRIPYVYTVQDMFPESLVSTGMTKKGSLIWKIGSWVSRVTYKNAAHIIVISEGIKKSLLEKGVPEEKITVVYNWIDTERVVPVGRADNSLFDEFGVSKDKFIVTYAGNLGRSQNVSLMVDMAESLREYEDIEFVIFGDGSEKQKLEERIAEAGLGNIHLFPLQPSERISEVYSMGDVSLVSCMRGVGVGAFPSKSNSILSTGTPVLASFDKDSDLCELIEKNSIGVCAEPENADALIEELMELYRDRSLCRKMGENARCFAVERLSRESAVSKRIAVYEAVVASREKAKQDKKNRKKARKTGEGNEKV